MAHVWIYLCCDSSEQQCNHDLGGQYCGSLHANYIILTAKETDQLPMKWYSLYIPIIETLHPFFSSKILNDIPEEQQTVQVQILFGFGLTSLSGQTLKVWSASYQLGF